MQEIYRNFRQDSPRTLINEAADWFGLTFIVQIQRHHHKVLVPLCVVRSKIAPPRRNFTGVRCA